MGPTITASSSADTDHAYVAAVSESKTLVFAGRGNLYAFTAEDNGGADCYIAFYDAAATGDVTLGVTTPAFTFRIVGGTLFGKDAQEIPLHFFAKGCVAAVTATRAGATAPLSPATCNFWSYFARYQG